jgi:nitric oxide reductase NorE protein
MKESDTTIDPALTMDYKNIYYPPGGILIWIIIMLELITFGAALIAMVVLSRSESGLFHEMGAKLNTLLGSLNTVVLITSGLFMARSLHFFRAGYFQKSKFYLQLTLFSGSVFVIIKAIEYHQKIVEGIVLGSNTFMNFYWLLTGFHLIHVLVGLVLLTTFHGNIIKRPEKIQITDLEATASFWHMCDLIWLVLFPVLYLLF